MCIFVSIKYSENLKILKWFKYLCIIYIIYIVFTDIDFPDLSCDIFSSTGLICTSLNSICSTGDSWLTNTLALFAGLGTTCGFGLIGTLLFNGY